MERPHNKKGPVSSCMCSSCTYRRKIRGLVSKLSKKDAEIVEELYSRYEHASFDLSWLKADIDDGKLVRVEGK